MKKLKLKTLITTTIICLLPILLGIFYYDSVPEQVAIHFDASNNPNSYMNKNIVLFIFPVILALFQIFLCTVIDLNKTEKDYKPKIEYISKIIFPVVSIFVYSITLGVALGSELDIRKLVCFFSGSIFVLLGNYLPKTKAASTHGVNQKSWSENEKLWRKASKAMGYSLVICGVLWIVSIFLTSIYSIIAIVFTIAVIIIEAIYFNLVLHSSKK